ncbi:MAG: BlaI/MecI/CopY family transcriptional regulator [Candidatus Dojkabacteria bacterium]|nr:MAG: BlaI/MecI/CopY family transcriptional regulator [Candidatus Dojkabacteria bacterium]
MARVILGELEQKIMHVMWESKGSLKPSEVLERIGEGYAYTTIMTSLVRLSGKGLLKREKVGKAYKYSCAKSKESFLKKNLSKVFSTLFDDYGDLVISQFVDTLADDPESIRKLKKAIDEK